MITMTAERLPHTARHTVYRDSGTMIHAFWTSNPDIAQQLRDPATPDETINRLWFHNDVEIVATATRFYKRDGAGHSGWIVESQGYPSDSITNKREAMKSMRYAVASYFGRGQ